MPHCCVKPSSSSEFHMLQQQSISSFFLCFFLQFITHVVKLKGLIFLIKTCHKQLLNKKIKRLRNQHYGEHSEMLITAEQTKGVHKTKPLSNREVWNTFLLTLSSSVSKPCCCICYWLLRQLFQPSPHYFQVLTVACKFVSISLVINFDLIVVLLWPVNWPSTFLNSNLRADSGVYKEICDLDVMFYHRSLKALVVFRSIPCNLNG